MNSKKKIIYWTISLSISAILIVLIGLKLYRYWSAKESIKPSVVLSESVSESNLDIVFGHDNAQLTVFMYSNYACGYCRKFFEEVMPDLQDYIESDKLRIVVKLVGKSTNESVSLAQRTAVCISEYGNFDDLHKLLTYNYLVIFSPGFKDMVNEFIDKDYMVAQCILEGEAENYLTETDDEFKRLGFKGTPVFVFGNKAFIGYKNKKTFSAIVESMINLQ